MRAIIAAAAAAACITMPLRAQALSGQDSSLAGVKTVVLVVRLGSKAAVSSKDSVAIADAAALELRKSGLRVVDVGNADAVLSFSAVTCDSWLRIDVEQNARLVRSGAARRAITWLYEDPRRSCGGSFRDASRRGVDAFLSAWLTANGR